MGSRKKRKIQTGKKGRHVRKEGKESSGATEPGGLQMGWEESSEKSKKKKKHLTKKEKKAGSARVKRSGFQPVRWGKGPASGRKGTPAKKGGKKETPGNARKAGPQLRSDQSG